MATKSVGTLSAKLLVDTKGWSGGFATAGKDAQKFNRSMATSVGAGVARAGAQLFLAQKAMRGLGQAARATARTFQNIESGKGGLLLSPKEVGRVVAANQAMRDLRAAVQAVGDRAAVTFAPLVHVLGTELTNSVKTLQEAFASLGITTQAVTELGLKNAFGWKLILTELQRDLRIIGGAMGVVNAGFGALMGRNTSANAATAAGSMTKALGEGSAFSAANAGKAAQEFARAMTKAVVPAIGSAATGRSGRGGWDMRFGLMPTQQSPIERGSVEAVQAIQAMGGDAMHGVEDNTRMMLEQIRALRNDMRGAKNPRIAAAQF